jgi:fumarylacetoacetate (FAA) hydrolase
MPAKAAEPMNLASLKSGRDGRLVVVSRDLRWCAEATGVAPTLQAALDDWPRAEPGLRAIARALDGEGGPRRPFRESDCASPLPRAYQWADGSAYLNHMALVRQARGAEMPPGFLADPLLYQGGSDGFLGPREPIPAGDAAWGLDFEAEIAVVVDDVPMGATPDVALAAVRLVMLVNDVSLRGLIPGELAKSFGFFQSKPASAFSPVAVTPDALGDAWKDGRLSGVLRVDLNGAPFGRVDAGQGMSFGFGELIAHAARTRRLAAGSIVGSGTVSNPGPDGGPGKTVAAGGAGYGCIAEQRTVETLLVGAPRTPFMAPGDHVRIEMLDGAGRSIFGAIDQRIAT